MILQGNMDIAWQRANYLTIKLFNYFNLNDLI